MSSGRRKSSIAANPVLIGAVTTLVLVVLVFLAYNANNGLPFVPSYDIKVEVPNAAGLVKGNEVRVGGTRVGVITAIAPKTEPNGSVIAVLTLKLNSVVEPVPDDTTVMIRPRSALGLKYVQLTRGPSTQGLSNGGTLAITQARPEPVEIDEFFDMFSEPTRRASQANLAWFGNAVAGRGVDLNLAIQDLRPFADEITPLMRNLSSDRTDLAGFIQGLSQNAAVVAPVAETQGQLFVNLDTTFQALASVARPYIQESISEGGSTGQAQRVTVLAAPGGEFDPAHVLNPNVPLSPNNEGVPSSAPANGGPAGSDRANYLHSNPYPYTAAPGPPKNDCEAGRETYIPGEQQIGNMTTNPGNAGAFTTGDSSATEPK